MMEKHSFGTAVRCVDCDQLVGSVWAELWLIAQDGGGRCDDCQTLHETAQGISSQTPSPVGEGGRESEANGN